MIFIIWGLLISLAVIGLLIILLLAIKPQTKTDTASEQQTYNIIFNKIQKEVDKLNQPPKSNLKYPNKIINLSNGLLEITEYNQDTGKKLKESTNKRIKVIVFDENEKYSKIDEYDLKKGLIRQTFYNPDGTVKTTINK